MNKPVRCLLGSLTAASLILGSSLPLMGAVDLNEPKTDTEVQKVAPKTKKQKPAVKDVEKEMKCGASMKEKKTKKKEAVPEEAKTKKTKKKGAAVEERILDEAPPAPKK